MEWNGILRNIHQCQLAKHYELSKCFTCYVLCVLLVALVTAVSKIIKARN